MYGWMLAGAATVAVLREVWHSVRGAQEQVEVHHATSASQASERDKRPSWGSSFFRSDSPFSRVNSTSNPANPSGYNNSSKDQSQTTTERPSVASQHSGDGKSKFVERTKPPASSDQSTKPKAEADAEVEAKDIESLIKKDLVPDVLKKPLSPSTYKDYFAALLYAEDSYVEKWNDFQLRNVTLQLHEPATYDKSAKNENAKKDDKIFVAFKIDSAPAKRPFLLSRDFVFVRRSDGKDKKFQGIIYRVVKSTTVLVEFEEEFYAQHHRGQKYDISFSFNRVCSKRSHQAISAASSGLFKHYLFPENAIQRSTSSLISGSAPCVYNNSMLDLNSNSAVRHILSFKGHPPYLVEGPLCVSSDGGLKNLSKTGRVIQEAVLQIYKRSSSNCRILICSPLNSTGDTLLRSLKEHKIPESIMFRANAAFREVDGVPVDIYSMCAHDGECFSLPSLRELKQFRVIFSTFATSFRLLDHGITVGHFSHIFLVDSSSATEPETMIPLSSFANKNTTVIVTGAPNNRTGWVRSDIGRDNGLRMSYFERLRASNIYSTSNPTFITQL